MLRTSPNVILKVALGLLLMLNLVACSSETAPDSSATPTVLSANNSVTTIAANGTTAITIKSSTQSQTPIQSQGLGLSKTDWDKFHGPGVPIAPGVPSFRYENNQYQVIIANDQVAQIERRWLSQPISLDLAKEQSKKLYPTDAKFIKSLVATHTKDNLDVFFSDMAKQAFASIPSTIPLWPGGSPGNFTVTYHTTANNQIESIVIALGINPT